MEPPLQNSATGRSPSPAHVRERAQVEQCLAAVIEQFGRLDIVVNNAAIIRDRTLRNMNEADWNAVIDTNLTGVFNVCKAAQPVLAEGGRHRQHGLDLGGHRLLRTGQLRFSQSGRDRVDQGAEQGTRQAPDHRQRGGTRRGPDRDGQSIPEDVRQNMLQQIPLRKFGEPDDIANAILFLCSDLAKYITGQTLHVNGGGRA